MIRRTAQLLIAILSLWGGAASAEGCKVINGVDYRFERAFATRQVNDAFDRGRIRLATYIYTPLKVQRDVIVLFSHGSTGGFDFDPREPQPIAQCSLKNFFLSHGYTLVVAVRRGRGESTGTYVEECDRHADKTCTPAATRMMSDRAIDSGLADVSAVYDQIVMKRLATARSAVILAGHSRGAVLSFALAAAHRDRVAAVLNFSGGWLGTQASDEENVLRQGYHALLFRRLARYQGPSLWLYADRDPLYGADVTRGFYQSYVSAGGQADYEQVHDHPLDNGHLLVQESPLWSAVTDSFLTALATQPH